MARPIAMMAATMPSIRSVDLSLAGLRLPAGSWATATLAAVQRVTGLARGRAGYDPHADVGDAIAEAFRRHSSPNRSDGSAIRALDHPVRG
jgi:hypothetical protein